MRRNLTLLFAGLALGMIAAWFFLRHRPQPAPELVPLAPAPAVAPVALPPPVPVKETVIQDGKTIDFSSGQPRVQDTPADRAALERAKREMDEAAKDVTFAPAKPASPEPKR